MTDHMKLLMEGRLRTTFTHEIRELSVSGPEFIGWVIAPAWEGEKPSGDATLKPIDYLGFTHQLNDTVTGAEVGFAVCPRLSGKEWSGRVQLAIPWDW